jgi:cell filamentation protein
MTGFNDPYCYPNSRVLRNNFDEHDPAALSLIEREATHAAVIALADAPPTGSYDLVHLCAMHKRIFGKVYPWAGQTRTVEIGKGSTQFMPHTMIPRAADYLFGQIRSQEYLRRMPRDQFVAATAEHLANLNHLHPFREGNGRTQRAFFRQLAHDAGWHIAWERMDPKANIQAAILSNVDPKTPRMREFLGPLVEPLKAQSTPGSQLLDPETSQRTATVYDRAKAALSRSKAASLPPGKPRRSQNPGQDYYDPRRGPHGPKK